MDLEADGTGLDLGLVSQKQEDVTCMVGMGLGHTMGDVVRLLQSEAYVVPVHYFALTTNSQAVHSLLAYLLASLAMTVRANRDFRRGVVELALSLGKGVKLKGEVSYQQAPWLFEK